MHSGGRVQRSRANWPSNDFSASTTNVYSATASLYASSMGPVLAIIFTVQNNWLYNNTRNVWRQLHSTERLVKSRLGGGEPWWRPFFMKLSKRDFRICQFVGLMSIHTLEGKFHRVIVRTIMVNTDANPRKVVLLITCLRETRIESLYCSRRLDAFHCHSILCPRSSA